MASVKAEQAAELITELKTQYRRVRGDEYAALLSVEYDRGWFYLRRPRSAGNHAQYYVPSIAECVRNKWVVNTITYLKTQPDFGRG